MPCVKPLSDLSHQVPWELFPSPLPAPPPSLSSPPSNMGRSQLVQCAKCNLNFLHEEGLGKHMKRVHEPKEQIKPSRYKCDRCNDEFETKDDFKKHKLPEQLGCELCERKGEVEVLPTRCELNFHIITHRTGKPKICDNCGAEYKNNKSMADHLKLDKTVSCRRCNVVFKGSCPLQRHIRTEHDTAREPLPPLVRSRPSYTSAPATTPAPAPIVKTEPAAPPAPKRHKPAPMSVKMNFQKAKQEAREEKEEQGVEPLDDTIPQVGQCAALGPTPASNLPHFY